MGYRKGGKQQKRKKEDKRGGRKSKSFRLLDSEGNPAPRGGGRLPAAFKRPEKPGVDTTSFPVKRLIEAGADVNIADKDGPTPAFIASQHGHTEALKSLPNKCGLTPWFLASKEDRDAMALKHNLTGKGYEVPELRPCTDEETLMVLDIWDNIVFQAVGDHILKKNGH